MRCLTTLLCAAVAGTAALAQTPPLRANAQVRLFVQSVDEPRLVAGLLLLISRDSITIVPRRAVFPASYALADVARFQVNRGRPRSVTYIAPACGAALGAWFGTTVLAPDPACDAGSTDPDCDWETSPVIVGAAAGAALFAVAGQLLVPEAWQDVSLSALAVAPGGSRGPNLKIGLALHVR